MSLIEEQKNRLGSFHAESGISDTIPSFLLKTYQILENEKYSDIICWTRSGEGFIVKKVKQFAENVLPIYFRHSNYTSFVRQLNMYDFHKTRQQNHENAFKNVMFKRGFKHLLKDIQRKDYKKNKENTKQAISNDKNTTDRAKDIPKKEKLYQTISDATQLTLDKLNDSNNELEKRALLLASLKELPQKEMDVVKLLDILFDAKKLQREMLEKLNLLQTISIEKIRSPEPQPQPSFKSSLSLEKWESKLEFPTTDSKPCGVELGKDDRLTTYSTLFASFRHGLE